MAENVGDSSARPDLELEEELETAPIDETDATLTEQEMAEAEAGCGQTAVGIPMGAPAGHPAVATGAGMPVGHPAGVPGGPGSGHPGGHPVGVPMERQRHGGARSVGFRPGGGPAAIAYEERTGIKAPRIIAWEITRSCNLSCVHCRAAAEFGHYHGELSLDQIKATIDDIVTITNPIIILTGGEPLMRPDIWEIVDYAQEKGAMPVIGTNATLITDEIAQKMADHKIPRISVSVDFPTAAEHDDFRQHRGAKKLGDLMRFAAARLARRNSVRDDAARRRARSTTVRRRPRPSGSRRRWGTEVTLQELAAARRARPLPAGGSGQRRRRWPSCGRSSGARRTSPSRTSPIFPPEILEFESPPGTHHDAFPLLLV